ncbi:histidine kinase [Streptomyces venezuelae]|uniref:nitrate- and nitrite sensing domain-containing protein n=1 Tax=Streptomyces venezuelae TaxID=54571 RepID=UPI00123C68AD|nr:nitrate- and nitrite sensing domain-containing protein [Streptomyces venezuelae]QES04224.1 histidine kinase [Streptomyces venezuelae]
MSLGTALLILAFVPGVALVALWGVTSGQTFLDFQRQAGQGLLAEKAGQPSNLVYFSLQEERRLSAEVLARRPGAADALARQRVRTDEAVERFRELSDVGEDDAPAEVLDAVSTARDAIGRLPAQRSLVDGGDDDQQQAVYDYYTDLISVDLELFAALSRVDNGRITTLSQPLVDLFWVKEMISRSDALLARAWHDRELGPEELTAFRQAVSSQSFLASSHIVPLLPAEEKAMWGAIVASPAWKTKTDVENAVLRPAAPVAGGSVSLPAGEARWRHAMDTLTPELENLLQHRTALVVEEGKGSVLSLLTRMAITTVVGLLAVLAVIWTTWRLTRTLRLRIGRLQEQAEALEKALPDVVERLGQGERIDVETEARAIRQDENDRASDELTRLGEAFNLARTSTLEAAVRQADQHRGFERLLQRIARRTQQLIGQQLKKLDELERRHEDPEILDGLFDLDHLTARLRRYEENLVILAGGAPHRRWRKPVPLLDVMRSAQGEVQDYRRVLLDLDGAPWIAARAVGPVAHVLAELMENALVFSRPPSPVEIRAARVSHGLAVEIEDRGLGMEPEQLAEVNDLMARPPRMDLLAHSEDIRLGLQVVARLANQYGLRVEFRTSAYGGTRVVVLVPQEFVVEGPEPGPGPQAVTGHEPGYGAGHGSAHAPGTPPYAHAQPHPQPHPDLDPQQDLAQATAPASGAASAPTSAPSSDPTPVIRPLLPPPPAGAEADALPTRVQGRALADVTALNTPYAPPVPYTPSTPPGQAGNHPGRHPDPRPHPYGRPEQAPPLDADPPLPRRVRQASLVDELKVTPDPAATPTAPPNWQDDPLLRPVPRRAGATIGAFQRRSRAARTSAEQPAAPEPTAPAHPTEEDRS